MMIIKFNDVVLLDIFVFVMAIPLSLFLSLFLSLSLSLSLSLGVQNAGAVSSRCLSSLREFQSSREVWFSDGTGRGLCGDGEQRSTLSPRTNANGRNPIRTTGI